MKTLNEDAAAGRFKVSVKDCEVSNKKKLGQYREKWTQWMAWYAGSGSEPNTIQSQMHRMFFNDLAYRAIVSVRTSSNTDVEISAHSATLAYLLDQGYVLSQVLSIQKLLDHHPGVISVKRLLKDVEKHRALITREIYVAGDGLPYDYTAWGRTVRESDAEVRIWGMEAPALARFAISKSLHETFDLLTGKRAEKRTRDDVIPQSVFKKMNSWISTPSAGEIREIRNSFIAHSADSFRRGHAQFTGVRFAQIDELQRAIVRVERALTDHILSMRVARDVVPYPPLGMFKGLDLPYSQSEAIQLMHRHWDELRDNRNSWSQGVLQDLAYEPKSS